MAFVIIGVMDEIVLHMIIVIKAVRLVEYTLIIWLRLILLGQHIRINARLVSVEFQFFEVLLVIELVLNLGFVNSINSLTHLLMLLVLLLSKSIKICVLD